MEYWISFSGKNYIGFRGVRHRSGSNHSRLHIYSRSEGEEDTEANPVDVPLHDETFPGAGVGIFSESGFTYYIMS